MRKLQKTYGMEANIALNIKADPKLQSNNQSRLHTLSLQNTEA